MAITYNCEERSFDLLIESVDYEINRDVSESLYICNFLKKSQILLDLHLSYIDSKRAIVISE